MYSSKHVLVYFVFLHSVLSCTFNPSEEIAQCNSLPDLKNEEDHSKWKKLHVINSGSTPFSPIKKGTFAGYSDVKDLELKGLSNEIQPEAWEGLDILFELHLNDNKFNVIPSDAFANLIRCKGIYIYFCDVREILPGAFNNVNQLEWLHFFGNNIPSIEAGVFTNTSISTVYLKNNHIKYIHSNAFSNMPELYNLNLEENELTSFNPQLAIGSAPKLARFYITNNKLTKLTKDMFTVMPNLEILDLTHNQFTRLENNVFADLPNLSQLDISNNNLEELQTNIFNKEGMKKLEVMLLHDNKLSFLSLGVLIRLPNLKKITIGGNPWQCPCATTLDEYLTKKNVNILCHDLYKSGQRPTCILTEIAPQYCIYEVDSVKDLPDLFEEQLKEYPALPSACRVD